MITVVVVLDELDLVHYKEGNMEYIYAVACDAAPEFLKKLAELGFDGRSLDYEFRDQEGNLLIEGVSFNGLHID